MEVTSPRTDHTKTAAAAMALIPGDVMMWAVTGSHLYGTATFQSDVDKGFVYVRPSADFLRVHPVSQKALTTTGVFEVGSVKVDWKAHEVGKFCRLLCKGSPDMTEWLFCTPVWRFHLWDELHDRRLDFITQKVLSAYRGYIHDQLDRLAKGLSLHTTGGAYNTKWAYHIARLSENLVSLSFKHAPVLSAGGSWREKLQAIRRGDITKDAIVTEAHEKLAEAERNRRVYDIPEDPPLDFLDAWVLRVRQAFA